MLFKTDPAFDKTHVQWEGEFVNPEGELHLIVIDGFGANLQDASEAIAEYADAAARDGCLEMVSDVVTSVFAFNKN